MKKLVINSEAQRANTRVIYGAWAYSVCVCVGVITESLQIADVIRWSWTDKAPRLRLLWLWEMICLFATVFSKDTAALKRRPRSKSDSHARFTAEAPRLKLLLLTPAKVGFDCIIVFEGCRCFAVHSSAINGLSAVVRGRQALFFFARSWAIKTEMDIGCFLLFPSPASPNPNPPKGLTLVWVQVVFF